METSSRIPQRYYTLDGLRGFAAILVVATHFAMETETFVPLAYLSVDLFFILSGFVIALNYTDRLKGGLTKSGFFYRRFVRLYPLYAVGLTFGGVVQLAVNLNLIPDTPYMQHGGILVPAVFGLFVLPAPTLRDALFPLNPPFWSLLFEMVINIFFVFALFRLKIKYLVLISLISASYIFLNIDLNSDEFRA